MVQQDIFTLVLPFLLSYIVFFLALQRVPILKAADDANTKKFSALIALIFAFFVVYFLTLNPQYQNFFPAYIARITIGLIGLLGLASIVAFVTDDSDYLKSPLIFIIIIIVVLSAWTMSGGAFAFLPATALPVIGLSIADIGSLLFDNRIIYLIVIGVALYWVSAEAEDSNGDKDAADVISKLIGAK
jgi:hypothetical protein